MDERTYDSGREPDLEQGAQWLAELEECLASANAATARAVTLAGQLAGTSVSERIEGLPLDLCLALRARLTGADRRMLLTAGEVLTAMPIVAGLFDSGQLSWGQVRAIVIAVRPLPAAARALIDQRIAAFVTEHGGMDALDPDQLEWAVAEAADELKDPRSVERREQRRRESNYFSVQPDFDGGIRGSFAFDAVTGAIVLNALDAAAGAPRPDPEDDEASTTAPDGAEPAGAGERSDGAEPTTGEGSDGAEPAATAEGSAPVTDGPAPVDGEAPTAEPPAETEAPAEPPAGAEAPAPKPAAPATPRARQYAAGLARIAAGWLGGRLGRPARPLLLAHVDIGDVTVTAAGTIELNVRGTLPSITQRVLEQLSTDADLRTVLFAGGRPLAVSRKVQAQEVPADVRLAVLARDRGCRFPGSTDPAGHADIHHTWEQNQGGDHHPDRLLALSRRHHTLTHRRGWSLSIDPATGMVTATWRGRTYRSLPRGTPLPPAPQPPPPPGAADPPAGLPF